MPSPGQMEGDLSSTNGKVVKETLAGVLAFDYYCTAYIRFFFELVVASLKDFPGKVTQLFELSRH